MSYDNITNHWSGSGDDPSGNVVRLHDYTVEIGRGNGVVLDDAYKHDLRAAWQQEAGASQVDFRLLKSKFTVWKNYDLSYVPTYGTWHWNQDPRDASGQSPNICVASLCLPHGATDFSGVEPFTIAHAWMHAYVCAVIGTLKNLDMLESWPNPWPDVLQNGPLYTVSTHGERAVQTIDWGVQGAGAGSQALSEQYGYFFGSQDPDSRADLFCLDAEWYTGEVTIAQAQASAGQLRHHAHVIKQAGIIYDNWGLDGPVSP